MAKIATARPKSMVRKPAENRTPDTNAEIERLAYQFFVERGYEHGHHDEDWLRAESIVKNRKRQ